jgi:hypothetical protein
MMASAHVLAVLLAVHVWFGTYSVLDVGKPGVPPPTTLQARWLHLIHAVPAYKRRWSYLRFVKQPEPKLPSDPPLVVFDAQRIDRLSESDVAAYEAWFHVIGEPCSATYSPSRKIYVGETSAACSPDQLLPPVPGEASVLKP